MRAGPWLLILILLGTFVLVAYLALEAGAEAGHGMPAHSVYAHDADGLATASGVLRQLGFQPVAVTRPIQQTRHSGLMILVEPVQPGLVGDVPGLSEADTRGLLEWIGKGNTLVLLSRHQTRLHDALGVTINGDDKDQGDRVESAPTEEVGNYTEPGDSRSTYRVQSVGVESRASVAARGALPLWQGRAGPGAVVVPHGQGKAVVIADASLWTHRGLLRDDNVLFLYNVAALDADGRRVYFDEYHHGIHSGSGYWDYLRYHDQQWNVLQLVAVLAVAAWAAAVRLGPAVRRPRPARADAVDYASAAARIYQRAGVRDLMAQHVARDFLEALAAHLRLRRTTLPAQILAEWQRKHGRESAERLTELVRAAVELRRAAAGATERMSERELLTWSQTFDEFLRDNRLSRQGGTLRAAG